MRPAITHTSDPDLKAAFVKAWDSRDVERIIDLAQAKTRLRRIFGPNDFATIEATVERLKNKQETELAKLAAEPPEKKPCTVREWNNERAFPGIFIKWDHETRDGRRWLLAHVEDADGRIRVVDGLRVRFQLGHEI